MTMQCREFLEIVDAYLAEELLVETNHEILRHMESCPGCREELLARRRLRQALGAAFNRSGDLAVRPDFVPAMTAALRQRAMRAPVARRQRWIALSALAASLLLAAVVIFRGGSRLSTLPGSLDASLTRVTAAIREGARYAAGDHRDCALQHRLAETPISLEEAGTRWDPAYRAIDQAIAPALGVLAGERLELVGAHGCVLEGRRFAHVVLRYRGRLVSVLVSAESEPRVNAARAPLVTRVPAQEGFHLAFFEAPQHDVFVVSELDETDVMAIAQSVSAPVYHHLAGA